MFDFISLQRAHYSFSHFSVHYSIVLRTFRTFSIHSLSIITSYPRVGSFQMVQIDQYNVGMNPLVHRMVEGLCNHMTVDQDIWYHCIQSMVHYMETREHGLQEQ